MKNGIYAMYKGKEYSAGIYEDKTIVLRSKDEKDILLGFEKLDMKNVNTKVKAVKYVKRSEVDAVYREKTIANYKGHEFEVRRENEDSYLISSMAITSKDACRELGMTQVDRGLYEMWVKKEEVSIRILRSDLKFKSV